MSEFEIEDGVPIPAWTKGYSMPKSPLRVAVESLEKDQSIFLAVEEGMDIQRTKGRLSAAAAAAKLTFLGRKFVVRTHEKNGVMGGRIWRTK